MFQVIFFEVEGNSHWNPGHFYRNKLAFILKQIFVASRRVPFFVTAVHFLLPPPHLSTPHSCYFVMLEPDILGISDLHCCLHYQIYWIDLDFLAYTLLILERKGAWVLSFWSRKKMSGFFCNSPAPKKMPLHPRRPFGAHLGSDFGCNWRGDLRGSIVEIFQRRNLW